MILAGALADQGSSARLWLSAPSYKTASVRSQPPVEIGVVFPKVAPVTVRGIVLGTLWEGYENRCFDGWATSVLGR